MSTVEITVMAEITFTVEAEDSVRESALREYIVNKRHDVLRAAEESIGFRENHRTRLYIDDNEEAGITDMGTACTTGLTIVLNEDQLRIV